MSPSLDRAPSWRLVALSAALVTAAVFPSRLEAQDGVEAEVVAVVEAFHNALASGDSTAALARLDDGVVILESGGVEDKEHYRSGHLAGDMRFAAAVPRQRGEITVRVMGDVAWAHSTNVTQGTMGEREINSQGAELVVLARDAGVWKITAIHWSSRQRRNPG
jgi:ketosteroid isomerase-like protein